MHCFNFTKILNIQIFIVFIFAYRTLIRNIQKFTPYENSRYMVAAVSEQHLVYLKWTYISCLTLHYHFFYKYVCSKNSIPVGHLVLQTYPFMQTLDEENDNVAVCKKCKFCEEVS